MNYLHQGHFDIFDLSFDPYSLKLFQIFQMVKSMKIHLFQKIFRKFAAFLGNFGTGFGVFGDKFLHVWGIPPKKSWSP